MKLTKIIITITCGLALIATPALAGEKTCCQKASADGKECTHKCCVTAHKDGKSCEKCNPNKEDLKLLKKNKEKDKKSAKQKESAS